MSKNLMLAAAMALSAVVSPSAVKADYSVSMSRTAAVMDYDE